MSSTVLLIVLKPHLLIKKYMVHGTSSNGKTSLMDEIMSFINCTHLCKTGINVAIYFTTGGNIIIFY